MNPRRPSLRSDRGFSLVEVLMAASILTIGMLGIAAMQVMTLRGGSDSKVRQTAVAVANGTMDTINAEGRIVGLDKYAANQKIRANLSGGTNLTQTFTSTNPATAAGIGSVAYTSTSWPLLFDAMGIPVPAGDPSGFYNVTVNRIEPTSFGDGSTQSVLFRVTVGWNEMGNAKAAIAKNITINRYIMY